MILAKVLSKIYKKNGIILEDSTGQKYICGNPRKDNPITIKLLKDNLKWKLILDPELEFPEAYMRNEILIQNGSLEDFLMSLIENLGREEITTASYLSKKIYQAVRFISNFNLPGKARKNVEHHYDIGGHKGEKLYDIFLDTKHRQYSCAYWKEDTKTLEEAQQNKIDHIIKKLNIKNGQKILEVGCGWGGMAFEIAKSRNGAPKDGTHRVTLIVKNNVLDGCRLFHQVFTEIGADYPSIEKETAIVDAFTQWLITQPERYDVCVTSNMFGDIVTDRPAQASAKYGHGLWRRRDASLSNGVECGADARIDECELAWPAWSSKCNQLDLDA